MSWKHTRASHPLWHSSPLSNGKSAGHLNIFWLGGQLPQMKTWPKWAIAWVWSLQVTDRAAIWASHWSPNFCSCLLRSVSSSKGPPHPVLQNVDHNKDVFWNTQANGDDWFCHEHFSSLSCSLRPSQVATQCGVWAFLRSVYGQIWPPWPSNIAQWNNNNISKQLHKSEVWYMTRDPHPIIIKQNVAISTLVGTFRWSQRVGKVRRGIGPLLKI